MARRSDPVLPRPQAPKITKMAGDSYAEHREDHPAYGMISASRVTSSPGAYLLGTDFRHGGFVTIEIRRATKYRSLNNDRIHGNDVIVKVAVSESQWAGFVSRMNMGDGVPCTLGWTAVDGHIPDIDMSQAPGRKAQFQDELGDKLDGVRADVAELWDALRNKGSLSSTERQRLEGIAHRVNQNLGGNLEFVANQFGRHVEKVTEQAKTEVAAYVDNVIRRAGLDALGSPITLELERNTTEQDETT